MLMKDLFERKLRNVSLSSCPLFTDYKGSNTFDACLEAIKDLFLASSTDKERNIEVLVTPNDSERVCKTVAKREHKPVIRVPIGTDDES